MHDVLTGKPKKPQRWYMPQDISLKTSLALTKAKRDAAREERNKLAATNGQTLTSTVGSFDTLSLSQSLTRKIDNGKSQNNRPFYENFRDYETSISMTAELHRYFFVFAFKL